MQQNHLEIILEDINHKFDLVLEGHSALNQKIDRHFVELCEKIDDNSFRTDLLDKKIDNVKNELTVKINDVETKLTARIDDVEIKLTAKIDNVETKLTKHIDAVAGDLRAHRADTESHPKLYQVKEG